MNALNIRNRLTDLSERLIVAVAEGLGEGTARESGMDMYTLLYLKWITNKDLLYSKENTAQCQVAAWMGEEFGGDWIHVYIY